MKLMRPLLVLARVSASAATPIRAVVSEAAGRSEPAEPPGINSVFRSGQKASMTVDVRAHMS